MKMDIKEAEELALRLIKQHCPGVEFMWYEDDEIDKFGFCYFQAAIPGVKPRKVTIGLHEPSMKLLDFVTVKDLILHEIAHALCPKDEEHGKQWEDTALNIGCVNPIGPVKAFLTKLRQ